MSDGFRDWIPAGEDTGAIGDGGYQDYVPPREEPEAPAQPEPQPAPEPEPQPTIPPLDEPKPVTNQDIKEQAQGEQPKQSIVDKLNPFKKEEGGAK